jgi:hypothetical protein
MEVIRYFLYKKRLFIYSLASLILALVFVSFTGEIKELRLFFIFFTELFFIRFMDDSADYEKDAKIGKMQLSKKALRILIILTALLLVVLNLLCFGIGGLCSVGIIFLIIIKEASPVIPALIAPVSGIYYIYFAVSAEKSGIKEGMFLAVLICFSAWFSLRKRRKDDF